VNLEKEQLIPVMPYSMEPYLYPRAGQSSHLPLSFNWRGLNSSKKVKPKDKE
jgi:hypothetical protein